MTKPTPIRPAKVLDLDKGPEIVARTQSFTVRRLVGEPGHSFRLSSKQEMFLLLPFEGCTLNSATAASRNLPGHSVTILPAGYHSITLPRGTEAYALAIVEDEGGDAINAEDYAERDPRVRLVPPADSPAPNGVRSYVIDEIPFPAGNPRIKFFQNSVMSINWVEYSGSRDRTALSPHAHDDFEQASLAITGDYIHHSRVAWGRNADLWQEDRHTPAGRATLLIVPPEIIHTTEGVGDGRHVLVDAFAPPREDFIERGWMHNAQDYAPVAASEATVS